MAWLEDALAAAAAWESCRRVQPPFCAAWVFLPSCTFRDADAGGDWAPCGRADPDETPGGTTRGALVGEDTMRVTALPDIVLNCSGLECADGADGEAAVGGVVCTDCFPLGADGVGRLEATGGLLKPTPLRIGLSLISRFSCTGEKGGREERNEFLAASCL